MVLIRNVCYLIFYVTMRYTSKLVVGVGVALVVAVCMIAMSVHKINQDSYELNELGVLPDFNLQIGEEEYLTKDSLWQDFKYLFIFYKPGCDHCDYMVADVFNHLNYFDNTMVILVNSEKTSGSLTIKEPLPFNFILAESTIGHLQETFYLSGTPTLLLYSPDHQLIYRHQGEIKVETIAPYLIQLNDEIEKDL